MTSIRDNIWIYYKSVVSCKCLVLHPAKWNLVFVNKLFPHALPYILDHNFQFPVFRVHWREKGNCSSFSIGEKLCPRKACLLLDIHIDWKMIALINSDEGLLALIATKISDLRLPIQHVDNFLAFYLLICKVFLEKSTLQSAPANLLHGNLLLLYLAILVFAFEKSLYSFFLPSVF